MKTTRIVNLCTAILLTLCTLPVTAADYAGTTFEIEVVVFSRAQGMERSREDWPMNPSLAYPSEWIDFTSTNPDGIPLLSETPTRLDNKVAALQRGGEYRVLFHKSWQQVLENKRNSPAILIRGGQAIDGHTELEGSITVSVARYLHIATDLWLSEFANGGIAGSPAMPSDGVLLPPVPTPKPQVYPPQAASDEPLDLTPAPAPQVAQPESISPMPTLPLAAPETPDPVYATRVATLKEERRLRSGELHYIDHPAIGILVEIRTVEQPSKDQPAEQQLPAPQAAGDTL